MPEHEPSQTFVVGNGKITKCGSLVTLIAHDADADVGRLNHIHIISSITNCQHKCIRISRDIFHGVSFLRWRTPEKNH